MFITSLHIPEIVSSIEKYVSSNTALLSIGEKTEIDEIDFRLEDENNTLVDLRERNWSFSIVLETY